MFRKDAGGFEFPQKTASVISKVGALKNKINAFFKTMGIGVQELMRENSKILLSPLRNRQ